MNASKQATSSSRRQRPAEISITKDTLSGLFHEQTAKQYILRRLDEMAQSDNCALFLIDIEIPDNVYDDGEIPAADRIAHHTGQVLSTLFRATDVVGRLNENTFLVFLTGAISEETAFEKASFLCHYLRFPSSRTKDAVSKACVGVYLASGSGLDYETLYAGAQASLKQAKQNGTGCFYIDGTETASAGRSTSPSPSILRQFNTLLENLDDGICLLEASDPVRVTYISPGFYRMLGLQRNSLDLPCDLKRLGIHPDYAAEYEQLLRTEIGEGETVEHLHRISDSEGRWLWRHVRACRIARPGSDVPVFMEISRNVSELMENRLKLQENSALLHVALGQSRSLLWEVNHSDRVLHIHRINAPSHTPDIVFDGFPSALLESGFIHPDSASNFRHFAAGMLDGKARDTGNFIMKDPDNDCYGWFSLSYRQICDADRTPVKALGIQERLPSVSGVYSTGFPRRPIPETLRHHLIVRLHANLTANTVEELWMDGMDQTSQALGSPYSDILKDRESLLFIRPEGQEFETCFDRERLLSDYGKGRLWFSRDFRRIDGGGNILWFTATINLVRSIKTGDIHLFTCFCDTQMRHDWENLLETGVEHDPVSGLYSSQTMKALSKLLICSGSGSLCALALIRMSGSYGRLIRDRKSEALQKRRFLAIALSFALGTDCVVGQHDAASILVFFPKCVSRFEIQKRIEDAFGYVRTVLDELPEMDAVRFVAGVITERIEAADYGILFSRASSLCELWENAAMDMVVFPNEEEDWTWAGLGRESGNDGIPVQPVELERALTPDEQRAAFNCVTSMLTAGSLKASMENVLHCLGSYYKASRVYILALSENQKTVTMLFEWMDQNKSSIQHVLSGMRLEKFPLLQRCLNEKMPIFIKSSRNSSTSEGEKFWHFTVFPIVTQQETDGFLCVENAREHEEDAALVGTLLPYLTREQQRYQRFPAGVFSSAMDSLSRLPNLRSYLDVVGSLDSSSYSSMGALSLDVPYFSAINGSQGYDYGRELLSHIAETLTDVFGKAYIFRTWDAEFVVLYPNTIMEVFISRCTRLRTMLQRRYPGQLRIGYTWADGIFSAKSLVKEARSIMRCENVKEEPGDRIAFLDNPRFNVQEAAADGSFLAYFQPKIDMRDGSLAGAEALVRGIDKAGHIILPAQFIESLEKNGSIRELDLMMLEKVMEQLSEWKARGLPDVKVSVNISRFTLFNPTTLASILAIQSHYPEISPEQVELEITETAGDIEKATLASVIDGFREYGICFELDDFGSHYANLSIFSNIRFNTIKLDRSLINELPGNEISRMLIENIIHICRNVGMKCVAEGVENKPQEEALLEAGCIYAQGYYYSRPLPPRKFEEQYLKKEQQ